MNDEGQSKKRSTLIPPSALLYERRWEYEVAYSIDACVQKLLTLEQVSLLVRYRVSVTSDGQGFQVIITTPGRGLWGVVRGAYQSPSFTLVDVKAGLSPTIIFYQLMFALPVIILFMATAGNLLGMLLVLSGIAASAILWRWLQDQSVEMLRQDVEDVFS